MIWLARHVHRHGSDHLLLECDTQPLLDDVEALFDYEGDREDEFIEITGPMALHPMKYDEHGRLQDEKGTETATV